MAIIIEEPTAEAIFKALQEVPQVELSRLREMLGSTNGHETVEEEQAAWYGASARSASRFFEDEERAS